MWIASAIQETALPSTPWNLVEVEMLERLAAILAEEHPKGCANAPGEMSAEELLKPAADGAKAILAEQAHSR